MEIQLTSSFQVLKTSWELSQNNRNFSSSYDAKPYLLIRKGNNESTERLYLSAGQELKLFVTEEQYCIGYEPERGKWISCPNKNKTTGTILQCPSCEQEDFFSCRMTCQGFYCNPKTPQAKAICDQKETYLYLTYVGGFFKVGVSLNPIRRWIEQGSLYGMILYKGYGLETRYYEHTIGTELDLKLAVNINDKINHLGTKVMNRQKIKNKFSRYVSFVKKLKLFELTSEPLLYNLSKYYQGIPTLEQRPLVENKLLKGTIVGVIGRLLVLQDKNSFYVTNLKELNGKIVSYEKPESAVYTKQRTMYDF